MITLALLACSTAPPTQPALPALPTGFYPVRVEELKSEISASSAKPRVYNFWATWCAPCIQELPAIRAVAQARDDFELVLVNVDMPSLHKTKVKATLKRFELDGYRNLGLLDADPAYALTQVEGWPNSIPVTFVVTPEGRRAKQFNTMVNEQMLVETIEAL